MNHAFDSDLLIPCQCGSPTLFIQFLPSGDWVISCICGHYWPRQKLWKPKSNLLGDQSENICSSPQI
jgi:hypothetical protein